MEDVNQENKVFIVEVLLNKTEKYYLIDCDLSISRNKRDSIIFLNKNNAYKIASIVECKYKDTLAKVFSDDIKNIIY